MLELDVRITKNTFKFQQNHKPSCSRVWFVICINLSIHQEQKIIIKLNKKTQKKTQQIVICLK